MNERTNVSCPSPSLAFLVEEWIKHHWPHMDGLGSFQPLIQTIHSKKAVNHPYGWSSIESVGSWMVLGSWGYTEVLAKMIKVIQTFFFKTILLLGISLFSLDFPFIHLSPRSRSPPAFMSIISRVSRYFSESKSRFLKDKIAVYLIHC